MKAVILTRVSTKMQEEGLSLAAQSSRLLEYAQRKDLEVIKTFEIIESSTRGDRKHFMEMINFCKRQKETIAIVADTVDRVQRSFKESVLLDDLMRQNKIELHFYRENMVLNSQSSSVDIMRWDFSVMEAKAYVLQLSENIRRSNEQKNKNGEITGPAPIGYKNCVNEYGKKFVRIKHPEGDIVKQLFELYSYGNMGLGELQHCAHIMGLKSRYGRYVSRNCLYKMLNNPFYYGELKTKRGIIRHIYEPLISKDLWDLCQEKKAEHNFIIRNSQVKEDPYILRGLIRCGITGKSCVCEVKKKTYTYITCYKADNNRMYIQEDVIMGELKAILNRIKLPKEIAKELQEDLKQSKKEEMSYCQQETAKLRNEQEKLKTQLDRLFDLMLDGELDKATFDIKRNEIQTKMSRIKNKIASYAKQDNTFRDIVQDMIDIAKDAGSAFTRSSAELKRYLLKFVFKSITLTEGKLTYELNFPFELFEATNIKRIEKTASELVKGLENKGIEAKCNKKEEIAQNASSEPQILLKNQGVRLKNPTPVSFGSEGEIRTLDTRIMIPLL